jgi:hypothetical protein
MWRLNEERCAEEYRVYINSLTPNALDRGRAVSPLKIKIPVKNLSRQRYAEPFNAERLIKASRKSPLKIKIPSKKSRQAALPGRI